jgi:hypothetical protein
MDTNTYSLEHAEGPPAPELTRVSTAKGHFDLLDGFTRIHKKFWKMIPRGRAARYYKKGGHILVCAFIDDFKIDISDPYIQFRSSHGVAASRKKTWRVEIRDISYIFLKPPPNLLMYISAIQEELQTQKDLIRKILKMLQAR